MDIEKVRQYCLTKKGTTEDFPFDEETLVFKVMGKIYALLDLTDHQMNLKCLPEMAIELREQYTFVIPGYHMNKKHWNTIVLPEVKTEKLLKEWIDISYGLIVEGLTKKQKQELNNIE